MTAPAAVPCHLEILESSCKSCHADPNHPHPFHLLNMIEKEAMIQSTFSLIGGEIIMNCFCANHFMKADSSLHDSPLVKTRFQKSSGKGHVHSRVWHG